MPINYKNYCKDWKLRSKFIRFFRAKNKCEVCKIENYNFILRGFYKGLPVYQDMDGAIFSEKTSEYLGSDYVGEVDNEMKNKFIKVVLTVAHLDHDIKNNSFFNLKAMCQKCHNNYDKEHRKETRRNKKLKTQPELF